MSMKLKRINGMGLTAQRALAAELAAGGGIEHVDPSFTNFGIGPDQMGKTIVCSQGTAQLTVEVYYDQVEAFTPGQRVSVVNMGTQPLYLGTDDEVANVDYLIVPDGKVNEVVYGGTATITYLGGGFFVITGDLVAAEAGGGDPPVGG